MTCLSTNGAGHHAAGWYQGFDPTNPALAGLALGSLVIGVLGVSAITGEYGSGTIRSSLAAAPRRLRLLRSQGPGLRRFALGGRRVLSFSSFFLGQAILSAGGAPTATLEPPGRAASRRPDRGPSCALLALFGLGLGAIIRHTAGAIATFVGCTLLLAAPPPERARRPGPLHPGRSSSPTRSPRRPPRQRALEHDRVPAHGPATRGRRAGRAALLLAGGMHDGGADRGRRGSCASAGGKEMSLALSEEQVAQMPCASPARVWREPFTRRPWSELGLLLLRRAASPSSGWPSSALTMVAGIVLAITFFGLVIIALSLRGARGIGGLAARPGPLPARRADRRARSPSSAGPASSGGCSRRCATASAWHAVGYLALKVPVDHLRRLLRLQFLVGRLRLPAPSALRTAGGSARRSSGSLGTSSTRAISVGAVRVRPRLSRLPLRRHPASSPPPGSCAAVVDRRPSAHAAPCSGPTRWPPGCASLEQARAQTVDASAATLRRIERDLHDGTQAQLVALAMRLGQAKEKLADDERRSTSTRSASWSTRPTAGAKEAIVELRDLARGIHPPALDIGLEGRSATLAARSTVPTELTVDLARPARRRPSRPSPTSAWPSCWPTSPSTPRPRGPSSAAPSRARWLRLVVRDDGRGRRAARPRSARRRAGLPG